MRTLVATFRIAEVYHLPKLSGFDTTVVMARAMAKRTA